MSSSDMNVPISDPMGRKPRMPRARLALAGVGSILLLAALLLKSSNLDKTIGAVGHNAIEKSDGKWSEACETKLGKLRHDAVECAKFPVSGSGKLHGFGEDDDSKDLETRLSWSAVRSAVPNFDCSSPHKIGRMTERKELLLVYHDNTVVTVKNDECRATAFFVAKDGKVNRKAEKMVEGAKHVMADSPSPAPACRGIGTTCSIDGQCCGHGVPHDSPGCCWGRCKKRRGWTCTCQHEGQTCIIGSDCCGFNWGKIGSKNCCGPKLHAKCQHIHNYNGKKRCGPKRTVFIRSVHNWKAIDVNGWHKHNGAVLHMWAFHGGNNQKFEVYLTNAWSRVRCVDSGKYWSLDASWNLIQTDWKWNDCKQRFKFTKHGANYKIQNLCHHQCLDFSHNNNGARVKAVGCNGNNSQKWRL